MVETSGSEAISTRLQQVAELAKRMPEAVLTTLAHHIDLDLLREAYRVNDHVEVAFSEHFADAREINCDQLTFPLRR